MVMTDLLVTAQMLDVSWRRPVPRGTPAGLSRTVSLVALASVDSERQAASLPGGSTGPPRRLLRSSRCPATQRLG